MEINCTRKDCLYEWNYKGSELFYATCPKCYTKVYIRELWSEEEVKLLIKIAKKKRDKKHGNT